MKKNSVIETMLAHKSIREYKEKIPSEEEITTVVRAGQQAPFASQMYSILLSRKQQTHPFHAPLLFTICVDAHKFELIMEKRNWDMVSNDLTILLFGIQDAAYMAQNMVTAGESMGLGSCFLGSAPYRADKIAEKYKLPKRVLPLVQLAMGYPAEDPPPRPRYPLEYTLFEGEYPDLSDKKIRRAMEQMDEGYLQQGYYRKLDAKIPLKGDRKETFAYDDYSWTEHISRKWGQWHSTVKPLLKQLKRRGFKILPEEDANNS